MTRFSIVLAAWLLPALAAAQVAGVPADALTPPGMARVEVDVPEHDGHGVRLWFAPQGQDRPVLRVDVRVAPDAASANDAAAWFTETMSGDLPALPGVGEHARGDDRLAAFVRDNVFVEVRSIDGRGGDARVHATAIDAVVETAPRGPARSNVQISLPTIDEGTTTLQLPEALIGAHVVTTGCAAARRTRAGWVVTRSGDGAWSVTVRGSDALLRRLTASRSGD